MQNLPQEIVDEIAEHLAHDTGHPRPDKIPDSRTTQRSGLASYATISAKWKTVVEKITFKRLSISSNELDQFQAIVHKQRRGILSHVSFKVQLPEYSDAACAHVESREEQHSNNECFTRGIHALFAIMRTWEDDGVQNSLRIELPFENNFSPTDLRYRDQGSRHALRLAVAARKRKHIFEERFNNSIICLLPGKLPILSNVQFLDIIGYMPRSLAPSIATDLAAVLPNLRKVYWEFVDCDNQPASVRKENRARFADALEGIRLCDRSTATIVLIHEFPLDQRRAGHNIVPPGYSHDPFSTALRTFSQNLTSFTLSAHLDSAIFWPVEKDIAAPFWPYLRTLNVTFDMLTPTGEWYFTGTRPADHLDDDPERGIIGGDTNDSDFDYTNYREHADPITFGPFIAAFSKAVQNMPVLDHFSLTSELGNQKGCFYISFYAPGRPSDERDESADDVRYRRLYYLVGEVWRPEVEVRERLQGLGRDRFGDKVIEKFLDGW
ncbi:hypothetical protein CC86DRAFT_150510 [Ophiobolus disseminans]|uniref:F-box domain-containing protein n=1 Tax=Ophiobolus disseminans TaxID=1469910 RepID=A0A6A6ZEB4_9PLEO|nr:hypothetical protein CC86DRAFT_150510 [Ophiobolus disseminans]